MTNDTGFLGKLRHVDTLKNSDHEGTRRNSKKFKVNGHSDRRLDSLDARSVSIWTKKQTHFQRSKQIANNMMKRHNLHYLQNQMFLRKLVNKEVSLVPKYGGMAQPSQEVLYAREKYQPDKVKIMMTKSVQQRDQYQFGMDIGAPVRNARIIPKLNSQSKISSIESVNLRSKTVQGNSLSSIDLSRRKNGIHVSQLQQDSLNCALPEIDKLDEMNLEATGRLNRSYEQDGGPDDLHHDSILLQDENFGKLRSPHTVMTTNRQMIQNSV